MDFVKDQQDVGFFQGSTGRGIFSRIKRMGVFFKEQQDVGFFQGSAGREFLKNVVSTTSNTRIF